MSNTIEKFTVPMIPIWIMLYTYVTLDSPYDKVKAVTRA